MDPSSPRLIRAWHAVLARSDDRSILVAEVGGTVVGTIDCLLVPNLTHDGATFAIIENFVVEQDCRRSGVGTALMRAAINYARNADCYKLQLMSQRDRTDAHTFYERAGFQASAHGYRLYL